MKNDAKARISLLNKIAKKNTVLIPLAGKNGRKDVEKHLNAAKVYYDENYRELKVAEAEASRINAIVEDRRAKMQTAKEQLNLAYRLLHQMDLISSDAIKLDRDEVMYARDNRWFHLNEEDQSLTPYRQYIKSKNPEMPEEQLAADDFLNNNPEYDGIDVPKEN